MFPALAQVEPSDGALTEPVKWKSQPPDDVGQDAPPPSTTEVGESLGDKMSRFGQGAADGLGNFFAHEEIESFWDLLENHLELGLRFTDNSLDTTLDRPAAARS
jgi:hypothetical protein